MDQSAMCTAKIYDGNFRVRPTTPAMKQRDWQNVLQLPKPIHVFVLPSFARSFFPSFSGGRVRRGLAKVTTWGEDRHNALMVDVAPPVPPSVHVPFQAVHQKPAALQDTERRSHSFSILHGCRFLVNRSERYTHRRCHWRRHIHHQSIVFVPSPSGDLGPGRV